jgi:hypothetical protein
LNLYIIDSHRPWDLNNVFLKEGGVFCVDDGDIEIELAVEGGVGADYEILLEVRPRLSILIVRGILHTTLKRKLKNNYKMVKMTNTTLMPIQTENADDQDHDHVPGRVQSQQVTMTH